MNIIHHGLRNRQQTSSTGSKTYRSGAFASRQRDSSLNIDIVGYGYCIAFNYKIVQRFGIANQA